VEVAGTRVLLTGASSGIGRALALELAGRGAHLAVVARRRERLEDLAAEIGDRAQERPRVLIGDLAKPGTAAQLAEQALEELGEVDILINNAGGGAGGMQWVVGDHEKAREALEINYWSPLALISALVPAMRERGSGAVVNVTSTGQVMALWLMGHYTASKAALAQATEALRLELHGSGVHVLEVIPGPVDTAVQGETRLIPGAEEVLKGAPLGKPEVLAELIVKALRKERRRIVYPRALAAVYSLPGLYRWYSRRLRRKLDAHIDPDDRRVVRTGSCGDEEARRAREAWETRDL